MRKGVGSVWVEPFQGNDTVRGFEDTPGCTGKNIHGTESPIVNGECPFKICRGSPVFQCWADRVERAIQGELASQGTVLSVVIVAPPLRSCILDVVC